MASQTEDGGAGPGPRPRGFGRFAPSARLARFARFCAVGAAGFAVDAGVLSGLIRSGLTGPLWGQAVAAAVAICVTFELNHSWAFAGAARGSRTALFPPYVGVQLVGLLCNFAVYAAALATLPPPADHPLVCLVAASGAALALNFLGADRLVFRPGEAPPRGRNEAPPRGPA